MLQFRRREGPDRFVPSLERLAVHGREIEEQVAEGEILHVLHEEVLPRAVKIEKRYPAAPVHVNVGGMKIPVTQSKRDGLARNLLQALDDSRGERFVIAGVFGPVVQEFEQRRQG